MDACVKLASITIKEYLYRQKLPNTDGTDAELLRKRAGCFVSLHTKDSNALRGCIGTILPTHRNLAGEIISNAVAACHDPRFPAVTKDECENLKISVDVLSEPEAVASENQLDPKKYGIIVKSLDGLRTGILLPNLDGINNVQKQITIAKDKAGILPNEDVSLFRFTATRYG